jgi:hypothetical protein
VKGFHAKALFFEARCCDELLPRIKPTASVSRSDCRVVTWASGRHSSKDTMRPLQHVSETRHTQRADATVMWQPGVRQRLHALKGVDQGTKQPALTVLRVAAGHYPPEIQPKRKEILFRALCRALLCLKRKLVLVTNAYTTAILNFSHTTHTNAMNALTFKCTKSSTQRSRWFLTRST